MFQAEEAFQREDLSVHISCLTTRMLKKTKVLGGMPLQPLPPACAHRGRTVGGLPRELATAHGDET
jgi:hypothetical protein